MVSLAQKERSTEVKFAQRTQEPWTIHIYPIIQTSSWGRWEGQASLLVAATVRLILCPRLIIQGGANSRIGFPDKVGRAGRVISALTTCPVTLIRWNYYAWLDTDSCFPLYNSRKSHCAVKGKRNVRILAIALLTRVRPVSSSALQSRTWQLMGMR